MCAAVYEGVINPDPDEVRDFCYKRLEDIQASLTSHPDKYTSWFHIAFPKVRQWAVENQIEKAPA